MIKLNDLRNMNGARRKRKRVGRGPGSGHGGTSTRGNKGAKSRSGYKHKFGFEGGQMPLHMRLPKRGFSNKKFKNRIAVVNIENLNKYRKGTVIDPDFMASEGLVKGIYDSIKILGDGEIKSAITVKIHFISKQAEKKIMDAGGKVEIIKPC